MKTKQSGSAYWAISTSQHTRTTLSPSVPFRCFPRNCFPGEIPRSSKAREVVVIEMETLHTTSSFCLISSNTRQGWTPRAIYCARRHRYSRSGATSSFALMGPCVHRTLRAYGVPCEHRQQIPSFVWRCHEWSSPRVIGQ